MGYHKNITNTKINTSWINFHMLTFLCLHKLLNNFCVSQMKLVTLRAQLNLHVLNTLKMLIRH